MKSVIDTNNKIIRTSEFIGTNEFELEKRGVYNGFVFLDSPLYIHPRLLLESDIPEFKDSYTTIIIKFKRIITLLKSSKSKGDNFWNMARKSFYFPEPNGIALGNSVFSTRGNGLTGKTALAALEKISELLIEDIEDPEIFYLLSTIQDNLGVDRISDMIANIIYESFLSYTERILKEIGIVGDCEYNYNNKIYHIFQRPTYIKGEYENLLFVPKEILSEIPPCIEFADINVAIKKNQEAREFLSDAVFKAKKLNDKKNKPINIQDIENPKETIFELIKAFPKIYDQIVEMQSAKKILSYDYDMDSAGIYTPILKMLEVCLENKFETIKNCDFAKGDLFTFVGQMINIFKFNIECKGLNSELYYMRSDGEIRHRREATSHRLFIAVLEAFKQIFSFDYSYEPKSGNGEVDFKFSRNDEIVIVEFKLNIHSDLIHGYTKQLPEYRKRERTDESYFVIVQVEENGSIDKFNDIVISRDIRNPVIVVDGLDHPSPSKIS